MQPIASFKPKQSVVIFTVTLIFSVVLVIFITYPKYNDLLLKREELQKGQDLLVNFNDNYVAVLKSVKSLDNPDVQNVSVAIPPVPNMPHLYAHIEQLANNSNLHLSELTIKDLGTNLPVVTPDPNVDPSQIVHPLIQVPTIPAKVGVVDLNVTVIGSYQSLVQFLQQVQTSLRILSIQQMFISVPTGNTNMDVKFDIQAYYESN